MAVHHLPGWDEFYREFCERLARHGYTVICPDLYCRFGHGTPDDVAAKARVRGRGARRGAWWPTWPPRMDWLKAQPTSNGKVGHHRHLLGRPARAADRLADHRAGTRWPTCGAAA